MKTNNTPSVRMIHPDVCDNLHEKICQVIRSKLGVRSGDQLFNGFIHAAAEAVMGSYYLEEIRPRLLHKERGTAVDGEAVRVAELLFKAHTHGNMVNYRDIVYRESDVINILKQLGHPEPDFVGYAMRWNKTYGGKRDTTKSFDSDGKV